MQKWEYFTANRQGGSWSDDRYDGRSPGEKLTDLGQQGWELVSVFYDGSAYHFYLKRPIEQKGKAAPKKSRAKSKTDEVPSENTESMENSI